MKTVSVKRICLALLGTFTTVAIVTGGFIIWDSWITPFERPALKETLNRVEELETCSTDEGPRFRELSTKAEAALDLAKRRAISGYDHTFLMLTASQVKDSKALCTLRRKSVTDPLAARTVDTVTEAQETTLRMLRSHLQ